MTQTINNPKVVRKLKDLYPAGTFRHSNYFVVDLSTPTNEQTLLVNCHSGIWIKPNVSADTLDKKFETYKSLTQKRIYN